MKETGRYYRSSFTKMRERGWTVIPWDSGQSNQAQVLDWLKTFIERLFVGRVTVILAYIYA